MSTPHELIQELVSWGGRFTVRGDSLQARIPPVTPAELRRRLKSSRDELRAYLTRQAAECASARLRSVGYVPIRSHVLGGETIVLIRDEQVQIPERWSESVAYTLSEAAELIGVSAEILQTVHETKRLFGGRLVPRAYGHMSVEGRGVQEGAGLLGPVSALEDAG